MDNPMTKMIRECAKDCAQCSATIVNQWDGGTMSHQFQAARTLLLEAAARIEYLERKLSKCKVSDLREAILTLDK